MLRWRLGASAIAGLEAQVHEWLLTIGVAQAFFAALILVFAKRESDSRSAVMLGAFVFLYGVTFVRELEFLSGLHARAPFLVPLTFLFYFFLGPTFYFYIKDLTKAPNEPLVRNWPLHIAPIVSGVALMGAWVFLPESARHDAVNNQFHPVGLTSTVIALSVLAAQAISHIQIFCYLAGSLKLLSQHLSRVRDLFSNLEDKTLSWLRLTIFAFIAIWVTDLVTDIAYLLGWFGRAGETLFTVGELVILYILTIRGLRQPAIVVQGQSGESEGQTSDAENVVALNEHAIAASSGEPFGQKKPAATKPKYAKSALGEDQMAQIAEKLETVMEVDKLFTESSLTLADLSRRIRTPQNYVSQTLNQKLGLKFYDYIARHRIEESKALLADEQNKSTILEIALHVGFNSKSTFNAAFKRFAGMTPSQFREENSCAA